MNEWPHVKKLIVLCNLISCEWIARYERLTSYKKNCKSWANCRDTYGLLTGSCIFVQCIIFHRKLRTDPTSPVNVLLCAPLWDRQSYLVIWLCDWFVCKINMLCWTQAKILYRMLYLWTKTLSFDKQANLGEMPSPRLWNLILITLSEEICRTFLIGQCSFNSNEFSICCLTRSCDFSKLTRLCLFRKYQTHTFTSCSLLKR